MTTLQSRGLGNPETHSVFHAADLAISETFKPLLDPDKPTRTDLIGMSLGSALSGSCTREPEESVGKLTSSCLKPDVFMSVSNTDDSPGRPDLDPAYPLQLPG